MLRVKPQVTRVGPSALRIVHRIAPASQVRAGREPYHKVQGWRFENNTYKGNFRVADRTYPGEIWHHWGKFNARVSNLPTKVRNGHHGACFSPDSGKHGWWKIHFAQRPESVDGAILAIEQSIRESLR